MTPRTTATANDEFDLTHFLWGDLPLLAEQTDATGNGRVAAVPASANAIPAVGEDHLVTGAVSLRETSPPWAGTPRRRQEAATPGTAETAAGEPYDVADADSDADLDALAALAELAEAGFADDEPAVEELGGEPDDR